MGSGCKLDLKAQARCAGEPGKHQVMWEGRRERVTEARGGTEGGSVSWDWEALFGWSRELFMPVTHEGQRCKISLWIFSLKSIQKEVA